MVDVVSNVSLLAFIGGGGDDLMPGGGVLRDYARRYALETGRPVIYFPNARVRRVVNLLKAHLRVGRPASLIGHSWGAPDAWRVAQALALAGLRPEGLITLDAVAGLLRRPGGEPGARYWLDVRAEPQSPDRSDRLTALPPFSRKPASLPTHKADRSVRLAVNHWDVDAMMALSGARAWLDDRHADVRAAVPDEFRGEASRPLSRTDAQEHR